MGEGSTAIDSQVSRQGMLWGALGVLGFSLTLPATRTAVQALDGTFVGLGRALVAAFLATCVLLSARERPPARRYWGRLAIVAVGVVIGFPLLTALALSQLSSAHSAVIVGMLPAATAAMAVFRANERPTRGFWLACGLGLLAVLGFAATEGAGGLRAADGLVLLAVLLGAVGYAEGGALARELGGSRVICWALVLSAPPILPVVVFAVARSDVSAPLSAWLGFVYVSVVSMFLAFFAWYRGLALGGVARVSQLQLAQPVITLFWSAVLIRETIGVSTALAAVLVLLSVALTLRMKVRRTAPDVTLGVSTRAPG